MAPAAARRRRRLAPA
ncbi:MAG: hypothetical protein ACRDOW_11860 [Nocardioidaceae bacterium]